MPRRLLLLTLAALFVLAAGPAAAKVIPSQIDVTEEGGVLRVLVTMDGMDDIPADAIPAELDGYVEIHPTDGPDLAQQVTLRWVADNVYEGAVTPGEGKWIVRTIGDTPQVEIRVGDPPSFGWLAIPALLFVLATWVVFSRVARPQHEMSDALAVIKQAAEEEVPPADPSR
ncbi:MAG: hypothetical protein HKN46_05870 [Acidimicrobiia bacterium]|nr:hypothetical protein [Acidimicrobiia bacterium]